jgi:hypothetical protein
LPADKGTARTRERPQATPGLPRPRTPPSDIRNSGKGIPARTRPRRPRSLPAGAGSSPRTGVGGPLPGRRRGHSRRRGTRPPGHSGSTARPVPEGTDAWPGTSAGTGATGASRRNRAGGGSSTRKLDPRTRSSRGPDQVVPRGKAPAARAGVFRLPRPTLGLWTPPRPIRNSGRGIPPRGHRPRAALPDRCPEEQGHAGGPEFPTVPAQVPGPPDLFLDLGEQEARLLHEGGRPRQQVVALPGKRGTVAHGVARGPANDRSQWWGANPGPPAPAGGLLAGRRRAGFNAPCRDAGLATSWPAPPAATGWLAIRPSDDRLPR